MSIYLLAAIGALIPEALKILEGKYNPNFPRHLSRLNFWISLVMQILLGVFTVYLLKDKVDTNEIFATACGFGGSVILSKILGVAIDLLGGADNEAGIAEVTQKSISWYLK